ncbi:MAG: hypothetical protein EOL88_11995 [Bacteroidia bacterium]|nr:hypothetical protein [Bacteroidia bacterium]
MTTLSQMITYMTPRHGRDIGWVWLKTALESLSDATNAVDNKYRVISIEITGGEEYEYEFTTPMDNVSYIIPNLWAETPKGSAVKVTITNKTKDGFKISSRKDCTYESVAFLVS